MLNAFTAVTEERALAKAAAIDGELAKGQQLGALAGVPFAVKSLFDIAGPPTLAGSKINRDRAGRARRHPERSVIAFFRSPVVCSLRKRGEVTSSLMCRGTWGCACRGKLRRLRGNRRTGAAGCS